ncbi:receptor-type tyrosine-protein phosphatase eta isoform X2 [Dermochelys coriacea]|uniref:receptor-type tyrosine-protein phosphatase eta isoform X2 n=1 Tax=Dermochelys coriacea TaxID=27794 RepID=UPI001CA975EA|nr:receptor-type tyrosine-protein phosphatase eta isoform X2 [Dermochelys coriacea]
MKQPGQLFLRLLLLLCFAKVKPAAACLKACSSVNANATMTEINIDTFPENFTISNVTFANGTLFQDSPLNNSIGGLSPGVQYIINFKNGTESCCKNITTMPSPVFNIEVFNVSTDKVSLTWENKDVAASEYSYRILIENKPSSTRNITVNSRKAVISDLNPGTFYNFTIFPLAADNKTEGDPNSASIYTMPSPVFNIEVFNVSTDKVSLTWENKDVAASEYSYRILIENKPSSTRNITVNSRKAVISDLNPGTFYNFTIFPLAADNKTEGDPNSASIYTMPSPVFNIEVSNVSTDEVSLTWENKDVAASEYSYRILIENKPSSTRNITVNSKKAVISDLNPGTFYNFTIFPLAADNKTEGDPNSTSIYTMPSPVFNIEVFNVSTDKVSLTWENKDAAASEYSYRILIENKPSSTRNITVNSRKAVISDLNPGTFYNFTIFPLAADNKTEGDPNSASIYTMPSPVFNIEVSNVSTDEVSLTWENKDVAASEYSYRIVIENKPSSTRNITVNSRKAVISGLNPGTFYNFTIFPLAADNKTEGAPNSTSIYTNAAPVSSFNCTPVTKEPKLTVKWERPAGNSTGFSINTFNDAWSNETLVLSGNLDTTITNLNYSTSYSVRIITRSCGKESLPVEITCVTSITDPPAPGEEPNIMSITHKSFKIQVNAFESKNGPLTAYAIVITTAKEGTELPNSSLSYTYNDFQEKKTNTYVTVVINATQKRAFSSRSDSSQYVMEVGNSATWCGYYNAPLEPLGSYRASVAGFTKIEFNSSDGGRIVEERSYVSFTPYSQAITLPQDPDVIIGAVVGCILGAVAIAAVVGFIFWRRRRKDGKNSELPFSPIRPKKSNSIKVESFESYFKKQQADSNCGFAEEYEELRSVGIHQPKFAAELTENRGKNRYNNVLPYDISRVKLSIQTHPTDDYINANYMPGYNSKKEFIAAQGPLPNTVQDFWRMIWEKNIYAIVMLTKCVEQGRTKCEEYWPDKGSNYYDNITVTLVSEYVLPEWTIRDFTVEDNDATESHTVRQFHFTSWPDHGVPETTDLLINFRHLVQENMSHSPPDSPTLVHCSAGVGRTGTFIAIDRLIQQIEMENTSDVYGIVYDLRMHRPLMVQTEDQYVFLNQCVLDIIKSQRNKKSDLIYQNTTAMAIYENFGPTPGFEKANGYHT